MHLLLVDLGRIVNELRADVEFVLFRPRVGLSASRDLQWKERRRVGELQTGRVELTGSLC